MNQTLSYYAEHAEEFVSNTVSVNFSTTQERFLSYLSENALILDFGCGSGRDTKSFLDRGYGVEACDGSEEICRIAKELTGIDIKQMLFSELSETNRYDGIWACASILHLSYGELKDVLIKMQTALKTGGIIYASFKYGTFEGNRNGRYFTDLDETRFDGLLLKVNESIVEMSGSAEDDDIEKLALADCWITGDVRPGRGEEKWLNVILRKTS